MMLQLGRRRIALERRLTHQQQRSITSYLSKLLGASTPDATVNPLLELVSHTSTARRTVEPVQEASAAVPDSVGGNPRELLPKKAFFPKFDAAKPHHVTDAISSMQDEQRIHMAQLDTLMQNNPSNEKLSTQPQLLEDVMRHLDAMEQPAYALRQMTSLLMLLHDETEWRESATLVSNSSVPLSLETSRAVHALLHGVVSSTALTPTVASSTANSHQRANWIAAHSWMNHQRMALRKTHFVLPLQHKTDSSGDPSIALSDDLEYAEALCDVEEQILQAPSSLATPPLLANLYTYLGLRQEQAKRYGYNHVVHQALDQSLSGTTVEEIQTLHTLVSSRLVPYLVDTMGSTQSPDEASLSHYLSATSNTMTVSTTPNRTSQASTIAQQQRRHDSRTMLRLEHHVTLDGALQCAFQILHDVMGLSIVAADMVDVSVWNRHVRLYHAYDHSNSDAYVGSFYVDPVARPEKLARSVTLPLCSRLAWNDHRSSPALMALSLELTEPAWDTDPIMVTWQQCEALFHEVGHVAQCLLSRPSHCLAGPQHVPWDTSELLSKFMEHLLADRSTLHALIAMSNSTTPLSDDQMDAAFRMRSHEKALQLAQQTYYGSLELALLGGFDLRGSEPLAALPMRLARQLLPHDVPAPKDLTPLLDVVRENIQSGRPMASMYRYLWCDALGASFSVSWQARANAAAKTVDGATDPMALTKHLCAELRQWVLDPGAMIDVPAWRTEFNLGTVTPDALFAKYGLES